MTMHKTVAADTLVRPEGVFEAVVATYDVDRANDRIVPGAFDVSLTRWRQSGKQIPIVWSHESGNPAMVVGSADPMASRETSAGLVLSGKLNIDNSAVADHVYDLLADGSIDDWSFGYTVQRERKAAGGITELLQVDLLEAGPCVAGCNPATHTVSVKGSPPERREPRRPLSHTAMENLLREQGILARVVPDIEADEHDALHAAYGRRRNGTDDRKATMARLLDVPETVGTKAASTAPVVVATFEVA
jgi:HK97 family phage prohead protease